MRCLGWLLFFIAILTTPVSASENSLSFTTLNWAPYAAEHLQGNGVASAIIQEACKRVGLKAEFHFMPWTRAMAETQQGAYTALFNAYYSDERARNYAVSDPYFKTHLVLCTRKETEIQFDGSTQSLHPYRLGVVRGYVNTTAIDNDRKLKKDEAENDVLNLQKLLHGRVDVIIIDRYQALHLIKNNPTIQAELNDIKFISPELESKTLHVMFSKERPNWKENLCLFNRGLEAMKRDGTLNKLMMFYGISVPYEQ